MGAALAANIGYKKIADESAPTSWLLVGAALAANIGFKKSRMNPLLRHGWVDDATCLQVLDDKIGRILRGQFLGC